MYGHYMQNHGLFPTQHQNIKKWFEKMFSFKLLHGIFKNLNF